MKALALERVVAETKGRENLTLKYDGTTDKRGRHVTKVEVTTKDGTYLVGLRTQTCGTAEE